MLEITVSWSQHVVEVSDTNANSFAYCCQPQAVRIRQQQHDTLLGHLGAVIGVKSQSG